MSKWIAIGMPATFGFASFVSALLGIWLHSDEWTNTAGVICVTTIVVGMISGISYAATHPETN